MSVSSWVYHARLQLWMIMTLLTSSTWKTNTTACSILAFDRGPRSLGDQSLSGIPAPPKSNGLFHGSSIIPEINNSNLFRTKLFCPDRQTLTVCHRTSLVGVIIVHWWMWFPFTPTEGRFVSVTLQTNKIVTKSWFHVHQCPVEVAWMDFYVSIDTFTSNRHNI